MKRKIFSGIIILCMCFIASSICYANTANTDNITIKAVLDKGNMKIECNTDRAGLPCTVRVTDSEKKTIDFLDQVLTDENGRFNIVYESTNRFDKYIVSVTSKEWGEIKTIEVFYYDVLRLKKAVDELKTSNVFIDEPSDDGIKNIDVFRSVSQMLNKTVTNGTSIVKINDAFQNRKNSIDVSDYESDKEIFIKAITEAVDDIAVAAAFNDAKESNINNIITDYDDKLKIKDLPIYTRTYLNASDDVIKKINNKIINADYYSALDWNEHFKKFVIFTALTEGDYTTVMTVLKDNSTELGISFEKYNKLSFEKQIAVQKIMASNTSYTELEDIKTQFDKAVEDVKKTSGGGTGGGSSSGSGSSGGSGSKSGVFGQASVTVTNSGEVSQSQNKFNDLDTVMWAADSINNFAEMGFVNGKGEGKFAPNDSITREEFVAIAVRAFKLNGTADLKFNDVQYDDWYYSAVCAAVSNNIIFGESDDSFGTGKKISREQIATIVYRMISDKMPNINEEDISFFDKDQINTYAQEAVAALSNLNIINGYNDNTFKPQESATRAEATVILARAYENYFIK